MVQVCSDQQHLFVACACQKAPPCILLACCNIVDICLSCRGISIAQSLAHSVPPATDDAKAERIRQLHHTLSEIIDERNDLRDQLETLSQSDLATELEQAECEILYLREQVESAQ